MGPWARLTLRQAPKAGNPGRLGRAAHGKIGLDPASLGEQALREDEVSKTEEPWGDQLRRMLGAGEDFWVPAQEAASALKWAHRWQHVASEAMRRATVGAIGALAAAPLGAWRGELGWSQASMWLALLGSLAHFMLALAWAQVFRQPKARAVAALDWTLFAACSAMSAYAVHRGVSWPFAIFAMSAFACAGALEAWARHRCWAPIQSEAILRLRDAVNQWEQWLRSQGLSAHWASQISMAFERPQLWGPQPRDLVECLALRAPLLRIERERACPDWVWRKASKRAQKAPAKRALQAMGSSELEALAQQWMPQAMELARERWELSLASAKAPRRGPGRL